MLEKKVTQLNNNDREHLKSKSPAVLPDNPSGKGWTANQIKIKFYEGLLLLFEWLKRCQSETNELLSLIEENANQTISKALNKIINGETTVKKASQDEYGNNIKSTYSTKYELNTFLKFLQNGSNAVLNYIRENKDERAIYLIEKELNKLILDLQNGFTVVNKALKDGNGNVISNTYINKSKIALDKASGDTSQLVTLAIVKEIVNDLSNTLVNGSIETLDTLKELANALGNDENFSATITELIGKKLSIDEAANTYLKKNEAEENLTKKTETAALNERLDNFIDKWEDVPKIDTLGSGRYKIQYEEWIGDLGEGRYSMIINT